MKRKLRVLIAKPGLDGHDRGARMVARALSQAGMEVVFVQFESPEGIARAAIQENVDIIGISILSGAHNVVLPKLMEVLNERDATDIKVLVGGTIPKRDKANLEQLGITVFPQSIQTQKIVDYIHNEFSSSEPQGA